MNLRHLEVFHAIMQAGSVTVAARKLNVSQPSVSAVLKHAEQTLGVRLFERIGGRLHPTSEALALLPDVEEIFGRVETLKRVVQEMRDGKTGDLVVASSPTLVNVLLPKAIATLRAANPRIGVFVNSLPTGLAVERVARREADIGIVYGPADDPGVVVETIMTSEIVCAVPARHPLARRKVIHARDLVDLPVISLGPGTRLGAAIESACHAAQVTPPAIRVEASSSFTACLIVAEGGGVALIDRSTSLVNRFPEIVFKPLLPRIGIDILLIFPMRRSRSRGATRLGMILRTMLAQHT